MAEIHGQLVKVAEAVGAIGKGRRNDSQGYSFRGVDDIMNACHPAFVKHGVTVMPEVVDRWLEVRDRTRDGKVLGVTVHTVLTVRFTFYALDGSHVSCIVCGEAADTADKATNKALSAAFKYALTQSLCIPLEDLDDSDASSPEMGSTARPTAAPSQESPLKKEVRGRLEAYSSAQLVAYRGFCKEAEIPHTVSNQSEAQSSAVLAWLNEPA